MIISDDNNKAQRKASKGPDLKDDLEVREDLASDSENDIGRSVDEDDEEATNPFMTNKADQKAEVKAPSTSPGKS